MISDGKPFDTNIFFSGGAGMFIQYHDVIKPVYLYAIVKMIITKQYFGLPVDIISNQSILSMVEWYVKRRYRNPLQCLDYAHRLDHEELDKLLQRILETDDSIYKLSPSLNIQQLFSVYRKQHMSFPVYVYSENDEPYIKEDCKDIFQGINFNYLHGDMENAIKKCDQNFTYIFSDIELVKKSAKVLSGTCSHVLLTGDYRYNYVDNCHKLRYDLNDIASSNPFIRTGLTTAIQMTKLAVDFSKLNIIQGGDLD